MLKQKLLFAVIFTGGTLIFQSCKREISKKMTDNPTVTDKEILQVAPSRDVLNKWADYVLDHKGTKKTNYTISKINVIQSDIPGKRGEIILNVDGKKINFIVGTFRFSGPIKVNRFEMKPYQLGNTENERSIIFSSGIYGITKLEKLENTYIFSTNEENLSSLPIPTEY